MAVKYVDSGGFNPFGTLGAIASVVPGGQAIAPWLFGAGAVTSAVQGDWDGAGTNAFGMAKFMDWDGFKKPPKTPPQWQGAMNNFSSQRQMNTAPWMFNFNDPYTFQDLWNNDSYFNNNRSPWNF